MQASTSNPYVEHAAEADSTVHALLAVAWEIRQVRDVLLASEQSRLSQLRTKSGFGPR